MATASNLGYPRIGAHRELKRAVEGYWKGDLTKDELRDSAQALRESHWATQQKLGLDVVPSNDFSYYDQVLDACAMVGAVPERFPWDGTEVDLDTYFAMARGLQEKDLEGEESGVQAMEMTKWFDTNYHYIVPEFSHDTTFSLSSTKVIDEYEEAKAQGVDTRPVVIGPVSFLLLGKMQADDLNALDLLDDLLPVYAEVLQELADAGCEAVQLDEPNLVLDLSDAERAAFDQAYETLADAADIELHVATYFGGLEDNLPTALDLPIDVLHFDLTRGEEQLDEALDHGVPDDLALSLGVVDGRNVWRADLDALLGTVETAIDALGTDRVLVGPSCSLLHVPVDLDTEPGLSDEMKTWFAFATQKIEEIVALAERADGHEEATEALFEKSRRAHAARAESDWINDAAVQDRVAGIDASMTERDSPHSSRSPLQREALDLPTLPTTTIGSFPQTDDMRRMRAQYKKDEISKDEYEDFIEEQIADTIAAQEEIGLDVLVHGEPERGDMVEHFGRQLDGFLFTENGWVQSYGTRCVRPPIIAGDVSRPEPMTTRWLSYANDQTDTPVKGMLTGPVTMLQWSFVRDDQSRAETCRQIALAIRDEVLDLEDVGIQAIQIDEPAFREGLPLREHQWDDYLDWAVECFRLASSGVRDETQIHTHMCYSEFNDIIEAIADMDADVISVEASRSKMELLDSFDAFDYPNEIGPGVYDIHSPRVPSVEEMEELIRTALDALEPSQMWVNPDCGLKTRRWVEVQPSLENMVQAAENVRERATA
ncbi:5-methyltetrahydropteroyltriglutamate--homocysteine S-methyltransferase [Salinibacter ruber]|uniref:5-methyltetrahydropteroyltriglutamate--homocysteine methyltransferase n=1 Tax=Salinibacter ruber TaxID=146919 RepID=A0A9X2UHV3_9BACT|nr:5-methyltetrahydropteroyltriglutamate--homocysteine S-methyltransferase [Salinibacter ruber]MCS3613959.1 5-methyltetrahydropteroyltriglutamate--homocysteine methyltransferase [Salinibacter ruber]MCS3675095.1 5-methyltetrahydropteroyltriglutamate--homocysteine methyltransferase [Salinibacter ruber]MCS3783368.1 5-methyltetrahydropteroyltriglutamate--homocysteine methyltransferase [Salinibacter ruber]MCS4034986.1 5-methyltetrahydropteroyltriglutamate--homocysteine methyltransferase [Salinibacte